MSKDKVREFIDNWLNAAMVSDLLTFQEEHPNHAFIGPHVAQLTKDYIDTLEAKLAECVAALEFYADRESWNIAHAPNGKSGFIKSNDFDEFNFGGRRAREVLAKVKK